MVVYVGVVRARSEVELQERKPVGWSFPRVNVRHAFQVAGLVALIPDYIYP